jgi:hypothetical protein
MKLYKALKLRNTLVGEITTLKEQIGEKNSYVTGSMNAEKFNIQDLYDELIKKIDILVNLKIAINEANHNIQPIIYKLSEYKALIAFWKNVSVTEGMQHSGGFSDKVFDYKVQFDEKKRNDIIKTYQKMVDALQEEIDLYNYSTEFPWIDDEPVETV